MKPRSSDQGTVPAKDWAKLPSKAGNSRNFSSWN